MSLSPSPSDSFTHRSSVVSVESVTTTSSLAVASPFRRNSSFSGRKYPSLEEILGARTPVPFDLAAFLAFAECNHCVEAVEFLVAAEGYRAAYNSSDEVDDNDETALWTTWGDLVDTFIRPHGAKEVNLTCQARSGLLQQDAEQRQSLGLDQLPVVRAPNPVALDHSCDVVREMVKDNLYLAFVLSRSSATPAPSVTSTSRPTHGSNASIASSFDEKEEQRYIVAQSQHPSGVVAAPRAGSVRVSEIGAPMLTLNESTVLGSAELNSSAISSGDEAPPLLVSRPSWTRKLSMKFKRRF